MLQVFFFVLISVTLCTCQENNDNRCSLYDNECQKRFLQAIAGKYAPTGIPQVGVPIIDPYKLESNITLPILGLLNLTLVEGEVEGIGKCIITRYDTNIEAWYRKAEIVCNKIVVRAHYKLSSAPIMGDTCGWCNIHGDGNGTIVLEDWYFNFTYPFSFVKREDEKIYLKPFFDSAVYETNVKKVTVEADSINSGENDITQDVVSFINNNWKLIMDSNVGKFINDESAKTYYKIYDIFFRNSPANRFLKDDLIPLLK